MIKKLAKYLNFYIIIKLKKLRKKMKLKKISQYFLKPHQTSQIRLIFLSCTAFIVFYNFKFFKELFITYGLSAQNAVYFIATAILLFVLMVFVFALLSSKYTIKPLFILLFIISSFAAYFMDTYKVIIDSDMIRNATQTDFSESFDLISFKMFLYLILLGLLPAFLVFRTKIIYKPFKQEIISKLKVLGSCLIIILVIVFSFSRFYTSFLREHKPLRFSINPLYWIYGIGDFVFKDSYSISALLDEIGKDSKVVEPPNSPKELIILVVGEAARSDRFSINGYERETNPLLKKEDIINFPNMFSCGTSTAYSLPCMFSSFPRDKFSYKKGKTTENLLDVLQNTKEINILWRDNNSDSKGVALRVEYENFNKPNLNPICDIECRDEGMLVGLDEFIAKHNNEDIFIILHQMGNHGPAYYKRYPKDFEKFTPICATNQLEKCTKEEINNSYDNAVLYTDYFLAKAINFLKPYTKTHETALIYVADHGESLGENGIYLHGLPYKIAPIEQKNVASFVWLGRQSDYDIEKLKSYANEKFSHDNLFHTVLGLFEVETEVYNKNLDILNDARIN